LYLRKGMWNGTQVVPRRWIQESTTAYSVADGNQSYGYTGYGYLWWVAINGNHIPNATLQDGTFSAQGYRGHYIVVIPTLDVVVVHRVNTDIAGTNVDLAQFGRLLQLILDARDPIPPGRHVETK
jgi:CubicO group peptidase (beta-lactamase class C family)